VNESRFDDTNQNVTKTTQECADWIAAESIDPSHSFPRRNVDQRITERIDHRRNKALADGFAFSLRGIEKNGAGTARFVV
jgi:hypothetical protein